MTWVLYLFALFGLFLNSAYGQISISPLRGEINYANQALSFELHNPTDMPLRLEMNWIDLVALAQGGYRPASIEERNTFSAAPLLQLSPAHLTLLPGERQTISVRLRDAGAMTLLTHEYRSHLMVTAKPIKGPIKKVRGLPLDLQVGVSVPIIVAPRAGLNALNAQAEVERVWLERAGDGGLLLKLSIARHGQGTLITSVQAILTKQFVEPVTISHRRNIALYPELERRIVSIPLGTTALPGGEIDIILSRDWGGHEQLITRRIFNLDAPATQNPPQTIKVSRK